MYNVWIYCNEPVGGKNESDGNLLVDQIHISSSNVNQADGS